MVITDFIIVCIGQIKSCSPAINNIQIDSYKNKNGGRYSQWNLMQSFNGYLYDISPIRTKNSNNINHEFFDYYDGKDKNNTGNITETSEVNLLKEKCKYSDIHRMVVVNNKNEVKDIINYFIEKSPIHKIAILFRLQGEENEVLIGVYDKEVFFNELDNNNICFNVCYLVGNQHQ